MANGHGGYRLGAGRKPGPSRETRAAMARVEKMAAEIEKHRGEERAIDFMGILDASDYKKKFLWFLTSPRVPPATRLKCLIYVTDQAVGKASAVEEPKREGDPEKARQLEEAIKSLLPQTAVQVNVVQMSGSDNPDRLARVKGLSQEARAKHGDSIPDEVIRQIESEGVKIAELMEPDSKKVM